MCSSTQRTTNQKERLLITPAHEYIQPSDTDIEPTLSEFNIPQLYPHAGRIFDYLPPDALVIIDDKDTFQETVLSVEEQAISLRGGYIEDGILSDDFPVPYLTCDGIEDSLPLGRTLFLGPSTASEGDAPPLAQSFTPNPRFGGRLKPLMEQLGRQAIQGHQSIVVSRQAGRLNEIWDENYRPTGKIETTPQFVSGSLGDGLTITTADGSQVVLYSDGDIFGWQPPKPRRRHRPRGRAGRGARRVRERVER